MKEDLDDFQRGLLLRLMRIDLQIEEPAELEDKLRQILNVCPELPLMIEAQYQDTENHVIIYESCWIYCNLSMIDDQDIHELFLNPEFSPIKFLSVNLYSENVVVKSTAFQAIGNYLGSELLWRKTIELSNLGDHILKLTTGEEKNVKLKVLRQVLFCVSNIFSYYSEFKDDEDIKFLSSCL